MDEQTDATPSDADHAESDLRGEPTPTRPRVWTVFAVAVLCLLATVAIQIAVVIVIVLWYAAGGTEPGVLLKDLPERISTPAAFIGLGLLSQLTMGLAAFVPAWLSPVPTGARLGLLPSTLSARMYPVIIVGSLLPAALGIYVAHLVSLVIPPDPTVKMLYEQMTWTWALPFLVFISVTPAIMEEVLFRGYIQLRLLERWSPAAAITVSSLIFGVFHVTPHAIPMAFIIGIWLGILAWRTGSVFPGMFCHGFINGFWNVWQIGVQFKLLPETPPFGVSMIAAAIVVVCFLLSASIVFSKPSDTNSTGPREPTF